MPQTATPIQNNAHEAFKSDMMCKIPYLAMRRENTGSGKCHLNEIYSTTIQKQFIIVIVIFIIVNYKYKKQ
jgi:hypothetical protein